MCPFISIRRFWEATQRSQNFQLLSSNDRWIIDRSLIMRDLNESDRDVERRLRSLRWNCKFTFWWPRIKNFQRVLFITSDRKVAQCHLFLYGGRERSRICVDICGLRKRAHLSICGPVLRRARYVSRIKVFLTSRDDMATVVTRSLYRAQRVEVYSATREIQNFTDKIEIPRALYI